MLLSVKFLRNFCKINQKRGQFISKSWESRQKFRQAAHVLRWGAGIRRGGPQTQQGQSNIHISPKPLAASAPPGQLARCRPTSGCGTGSGPGRQRQSGLAVCTGRGARAEKRWCCPGISGTVCTRSRAEEMPGRAGLAFPDKPAPAVPRGDRKCHFAECHPAAGPARPPATGRPARAPIPNGQQPVSTRRSPCPRAARLSVLPRSFPSLAGAEPAKPRAGLAPQHMEV